MAGTSSPQPSIGTGPTLGPVVATVHLPSSGSGWGMRAGPGSLWLWNQGDGSVGRIDPATGSLAWSTSLGAGISTIYGSPSAVEPVGSAGWALDVADHEAVQLDPATGAPVRTVSIRPVAPGVPYDPQDLAIDGTSLWVSDFAAGDVRRFDLASGRLRATIAVPNPTAVLLASGSLWVTEHRDAKVVRIDPRSNAVVATIPMPGFGIDGVCGMCLGRLVAAEGAIWVPIGHGNALVSIDPSTNAITHNVVFPSRNAALDTVNDVTFAGGSAWAVASQNGDSCDFDQDYIARIDPAAGTIVSTQLVGCASAIASTDRDLWVVLQDRGVVARIRAGS